MGWFGPSGNCGCCGPAPLSCSCPGGGLSRKFIGDPVLKMEVTGLPSVHVFEQVFVDPLLIKYWSTTTLSGMSAANGTYMTTLPKNEDGCIRFDSNFFVPPVFVPVSYESTRRRVQSPSDCTVVSTTTPSGTVNLTVGRSFTVLDQSIRCSIGIAMTEIFATFTVSGTQVLLCPDDYDASKSNAMVNIGISGSPTLSYNSSEGVIWWLQRPIDPGDCTTESPYEPVPLGSIHAEIIDDV